MSLGRTNLVAFHGNPLFLLSHDTVHSQLLLLLLLVQTLES